MNHVDGEIMVPQGEIRFSDQELRSMALQQAVAAGAGRANKEWVLSMARTFEEYLRNGIPDEKTLKAELYG